MSEKEPIVIENMLLYKEKTKKEWEEIAEHATEQFKLESHSGLLKPTNGRLKKA
jgi:hypothetical protein